jgi:hypothetical protein
MTWPAMDPVSCAAATPALASNASSKHDSRAVNMTIPW